MPVLPGLRAPAGREPDDDRPACSRSFGVTLLAVSVPMGAISDRIGRKLPLVIGMLALAGSTLMFAHADSLPTLFAARMIQGAADGVTWVVGFALIADCYGPEERGRVMGYVMSGTSFGIMVGPSIGGWLYEAGGVALPFRVRGGARARLRGRVRAAAAAAALGRSIGRAPRSGRSFACRRRVLRRRRSSLTGADDRDARAGAAAVLRPAPRAHAGADRPAVRDRRRRIDSDAARLRSDDRSLGSARLTLTGLVLTALAAR